MEIIRKQIYDSRRLFEINSEINEVTSDSYVSFSRTCREQYDVSRKRCLRNYAIASVAVVFAGPFTAGVVTAIGGAAATAAATAAVGIYASCLGDANDDYDDCVK